MPGEPGAVLEADEGAGAATGFATPADSTPANGEHRAYTREDADELEIHGSVISRLRRRTGNGDRDADFETLLSVRVGNPDKDPYSGSFIGRMSKDLGGGSDPSFSGLNDTYSSSWHGRLYEAYLDVNQIEGLETLRIGRQALYDTPEYLSFDGFYVVTEPTEDLSVKAGLYGGRPDRQFETSESDDSVGGAFVEARPWRGGRVRADYTRIEDDERFAEDIDHLLAFRVWQSFDQYLQVRGGYSRIEGSSRDVDAAATFYAPEIDLSVQASYEEQLSTQRKLTTEFDPFFDTLLTYSPFQRGRVLLSKGFGEHWIVEGGSEVRRVKNSGDVGEFNRNFERHHLTGIAQDVVAEDLDVSLTGEYWDDNDRDSFATWGLDLTQDTTEFLRTSIGTSYARWKNDFLVGEERENARTYYARWRYKSSPRTTWSFGYDYENNELDTFHTLRTSMSWRF